MGRFIGDPVLIGLLKLQDEGTIRELVRLSEANLAAQLTAAIASDSRALTYSGFLTAAATVLVGAAYGCISGEKVDWLASGVASSTALIFVVAACIATHSAKAVPFAFVGSQPARWLSDLRKGKSLPDGLAELCAHYSQHIDENRAQMMANGRWFNLARRMSMAGLIYGCLGFLLIVVNRLA